MTMTRAELIAAIVEAMEELGFIAPDDTADKSDTVQPISE